MIEKICLLFLFCAVTTKAQNYCTSGQDIFPWNLYRCPPFLANRTVAQRAQYFAIANNCTAPISQIKTAMINWGKKFGGGSAVENYLKNISMFINSVSGLVKIQVGASKMQADMELMLTNDTITQSQRNLYIMAMLNSNDYAQKALVNAYNQYGAGPFKSSSTGSININQFGSFGNTGYTSYPNQFNQFNPQNPHGSYNPYGQSNGFNQQGQWNNNNNNNQWNVQSTSYNQQYCKYGSNIYPWFPYRCPYFLSNLTDVQRDAYFTIANNKALQTKSMTDGLLDWGVNTLKGNISYYMRAVDNWYNLIGLRINASANPVANHIVSLLKDKNLTQSEREYRISGLLASADPSVRAIVSEIFRYGNENDFAQFINNYTISYASTLFTTTQPSINLNPFNIFGNFGNNGQTYGSGQQGQWNNNPYNQQIQPSNFGLFGFLQVQNGNNPFNQNNLPWSLPFGQEGFIFGFYPYTQQQNQNGMQLQLPCTGMDGFNG